MRKDFEPEREVTKVPEPGGKMDRRDFFVTAGKMVIPTIALMGLSLSGLTEKALAAGCDDCNRNCKDSCLGGCSGGCQGDCSGGCYKTCSGCSGTAK